MRIEEQILLPASTASAWDLLWQVQRLAACLPGCTEAQELEPGKRYRVHFEDHIGPYKTRFDMDVVVEEARSQEFIRILAIGQDKVLGTSHRIMLDIALQEQGPLQTALEVRADIEILGRVATLGQFAIRRKIRSITKKFAENIQMELQPQTGGAHA